MGLSASPHSQADREMLGAIPDPLPSSLLPVARKVFWWDAPEKWLHYPIRFGAQVMTFGDWDDIALTVKVLGESIFKRVLENPPPGVFDIKSWNFWHCRYNLEVPPLPVRQL